MNSALLKLIAVVLGMPLFLLLIIVIAEWYVDAIYIPTIPPPNSQRIQHPGYHQVALEAVHRFRELPEMNRRTILGTVDQAILPLSAWLNRLRQTEYRVMCLGEDHHEHTRQFLAEYFFPQVKVDVLLLEATPKQMTRIMGRFEGGKPYVRLLDVDIAAILRAAKRNNPSIDIYGIEETKRQRISRQRQRRGRRDESIAANLRERYQPNRHHVILFGALHCTSQPGWLFDVTRSTMQQLSSNMFLNVRILGEHQDGPLESFIYFLDEVGIDTGDFVISDTDALHPYIEKWFPLLAQGTLSKYQTVIIFRP